MAEYQTRRVLDVTTDSQSVCKRLNRSSLAVTSMDIFERFENTKDCVAPFWVDSHMEEKEFKAKFSEQHEWRRLLNAHVDDLVGKRANHERNIPEEVEMRARDAVSRQVNKILASTVQALLGYDHDQGALIQWVEKPGTTSSQKPAQPQGSTALSKKNHENQQKNAT